MAEPVVWGMLPKAQDDNTTIDEAIAQAIADHEADPEAHLGEGESLQIHRQNDMIDHPQGSVPLDKVSKQELYHYDNFLSPVEVYDPDGDVTSGNGIIGLSIFHVVSGYSNARVPIPLFQNISFPSKEIVAQFDAYFDYSATVATGLLTFSSSGDGFGLYLASNTLKAFIEQNGSRTYSSALTYTPGTWVTVRFHLVPLDSKIYVYFDDVQVASISTGSSSAPDMTDGLFLQVNAGGTTYSFISVSSLRVGYKRDLL